MANKDYTKIKRTMGDFSQNLGSVGSGLAPVNALPEKGNVNSLYKLPNGDIYSWFHEEIEEEIVIYKDLEVGKNYKFKDTVLAGEIKEFLQGLTYEEGDGVIIHFEEEPQSPYFYVGSNMKVKYIKYTLGTEVDNSNNYDCNSYASDDEEVTGELNGFSDYPTIQITEYFVNQLSREDVAKQLSDFNFLFEREVDHTETVTTVSEGYMKVNGPTVLEADKIIDNTIALDDENYDALSLYNSIDNGLDVRLLVKNSETSYFYNYLKGYEYFEVDDPDYGTVKGVGLMFDDKTRITIVLIDLYMDETISGKELNDYIAPFSSGSTIYWGTLFNNYLVPYFTNKEMDAQLANNSMIISCFDGTINLKLEYNTEPVSESGWTTLTPVINATSGTPEKEPIVDILENLDSFSDFNGSTATISDPWDADYQLQFDDSKNYSTTIVATFADGTTKTVKMHKGFVEEVIRETVVSEELGE